MNFTTPPRDKTDMDEVPPPVEVGNVYRSKGGKDTAFWIIVGVRGNAAHAIGIDCEGEIRSTTSYGVHTFQRRQLMGRCEGILDLTLDITWRKEP